MWAYGSEKRLLSWREFRKYISKLSKEEAILETARLWSQAPISNQYLAADLIGDWPDPWNLIHYNQYDDISVTLGMVYTLALADDRFNDAEFIVLQKKNGEVYHTAWFENGKYIVNLEYNEVSTVSNLSKDFAVKYKYSYEDLQISKYK